MKWCSTFLLILWLYICIYIYFLDLLLFIVKFFIFKFLIISMFLY